MLIKKNIIIVVMLSGAFFANAADLKIKVINTGEVKPLEAFTYSGGSFFKKKEMIHPSFLITHNDEQFLFDAGLGVAASAEFKTDMPWWAKPLMGFTQFGNLIDQFRGKEGSINRIIPSHLHFDHISGALDFPNTEVWATETERDFFLSDKSFSNFPSTKRPTTKWHIFKWTAIKYRGYEKSLDIYGDDSIVLVSMPGHTPGSLGMFMNFKNGDIVFFVGDTVWNNKAIESLAPKFFISRWMVDNDAASVSKQIEHLHALKKEFPNILIVPTHDLKQANELTKYN